MVLSPSMTITRQERAFFNTESENLIEGLLLPFVSVRLVLHWRPQAISFGLSLQKSANEFTHSLFLLPGCRMKNLTFA